MKFKDLFDFGYGCTSHLIWKPRYGINSNLYIKNGKRFCRHCSKTYKTHCICKPRFIVSPTMFVFFGIIAAYIIAISMLIFNLQDVKASNEEYINIVDTCVVKDTKTENMHIFTEKINDTQIIEPDNNIKQEIKKIDIPIDDYKDAARYLAKTVYGEARGCSTTQQAAVIWCVLNRVDSDNLYSPDEVIKVITKKNQFHGYIPSNPVTDEHYNLAIDVLTRWLREKSGEANVGRVLPKNYLYFSGDGKVNHYRTDWDGGNRWDWSLKSPYKEV